MQQNYFLCPWGEHNICGVFEMEPINARCEASLSYENILVTIMKNGLKPVEVVSGSSYQVARTVALKIVEKDLKGYEYLPDRSLNRPVYLGLQGEKEAIILDSLVLQPSAAREAAKVLLGNWLVRSPTSELCRKMEEDVEDVIRVLRRWLTVAVKRTEFEQIVHSAPIAESNDVDTV